MSKSINTRKCISIRFEYEDGSAEWASGDHANEVWLWYMNAQLMYTLHGAEYKGPKMESSEVRSEVS